MKKADVLMLFHSPYIHPRGYDYKDEFSDPDNMYTEKDVLKALKANGHRVRLLGLHNSIAPLFEEVEENRPDVIFNLVEVFDEKSHLEQNIAAILEVLGIPFTGATSENLLLCNNKQLHKKIFKFHRIGIARFQTFYRGHKIKKHKRLQLPAIVKPLCEEASRGISQASVVDSEESLEERIRFIHDSMDMDAIAEEYIDGREFYVSVLGHKRLTVLPIREMVFGELPEDARIATYKAKWDDKYRDKWGIKSVFTGKLPAAMEERIIETCKRAYRALDMKSYIRFDVRVTSDEKVYIIEPNANPCIARIDEVAQSAVKAGMSYHQLMNKILELGLKFSQNR